MESPETFDDYFLLIEAFLVGGQIEQFLPNALDCKKFAQVFFNEANTT